MFDKLFASFIGQVYITKQYRKKIWRWIVEWIIIRTWFSLTRDYSVVHMTAQHSAVISLLLDRSVLNQQKMNRNKPYNNLEYVSSTERSYLTEGQFVFAFEHIQKLLSNSISAQQWGGEAFNFVKKRRRRIWSHQFLFIFQKIV